MSLPCGATAPSAEVEARLKSLEARFPGFPAGVPVLLVAAEGSGLHAALSDCGYDVRLARSREELRAALAPPPERNAPALALAEAALALGWAELAEGAALPVVWVVEGGFEEAAKAVAAGGVDVLHPPVSSLRLRTLWQHVVRREVERAAAEATPASPAGKRPAGRPAPVSPAAKRRPKAKATAAAASPPPAAETPSTSALAPETTQATDDSAGGPSVSLDTSVSREAPAEQHRRPRSRPATRAAAAKAGTPPPEWPADVEDAFQRALTELGARASASAVLTRMGDPDGVARSDVVTRLHARRTASAAMAPPAPESPRPRVPMPRPPSVQPVVAQQQERWAQARPSTLELPAPGRVVIGQPATACTLSPSKLQSQLLMRMPPPPGRVIGVPVVRPAHDAGGPSLALPPVVVDGAPPQQQQRQRQRQQQQQQQQQPRVRSPRPLIDRSAALALMERLGARIPPPSPPSSALDDTQTHL